MRPLLIACALFASACSLHKSELDETLDWMDNTYNEHPNVSMAFGHGKTGWFVHEKESGQKLAYGTIQRFSYSGCDMVLISEDDPVAENSKGIFTTTKSTFKLGDIDISSIKVRSYTHFGGSACDESPQSLAAGFECDHAEMAFKTRSEAPLITEDWHSVYPNLTGADHENRHTVCNDSPSQLRAAFKVRNGGLF